MYPERKLSGRAAQNDKGRTMQHASLELNQRLSSTHLEMLRRGSGISDEVIAARGYRTTTDPAPRSPSAGPTRRAPSMKGASAPMRGSSRGCPAAGPLEFNARPAGRSAPELGLPWEEVWR